MTINQRVSSFTSALDFQDVPEAIREKARVSLLHNLGVAMAGQQMVPAPYAYAEALGGAGRGGASRLLITGRETTEETAAFVNGALIHARAQDDVFFPGLTHVGATITPAVLAVGEAHDSSGESLITALIAGYEAAAALSEGLAARTTARGFRATGLYGVLGAAAAVARLVELDEVSTVHALGIAASIAGGTNQTWWAGTQEWQLQAGHAARDGVMAVALARAGATGAADALEGSAGFYQAFLGERDGLSEIACDLGSTWRSQAVTYKPYPVCAILQAPVTEAVDLATQQDLVVDQVTRVRLSLPPAEASYPGTDSTGPFHDVGGTLMSAQYCLAVALTERTVAAADLRRQDDGALMSLVRRIEVRSDEGLAPQSFQLEVDLAEGTLERSVSSSANRFNWDRDGVARQLQGMLDEMPLDGDGLDHLCRVVLAAHEHSVRDIVSACVLPAHST